MANLIEHWLTDGQVALLVELLTRDRNTPLKLVAHALGCNESVLRAFAARHGIEPRPIGKRRHYHSEAAQQTVKIIRQEMRKAA